LYAAILSFKVNISQANECYFATKRVTAKVGCSQEFRGWVQGTFTEGVSLGSFGKNGKLWPD